jgi:glutamate N-acetyltransferase/amino-acid N-acetyltransferase
VYKALVINTGNANAGTGRQGQIDALMTCQSLSENMGIPVESILPFSTGVILEHLPMDKLLKALPVAIANLTANNWANAASAIMTTDVAPKAYSTNAKIGNEQIKITGISKGAGMIHPNMATMLGYVATDANVSQSLLDEITKEIADLSFNCISVDGDTSTNDSFIIIATGKSNASVINSREDEGFKELFNALLETSQYLAKAIVRDGEGATKFLTITVNGALSINEAKTIGFSIGKSPLVKTAMFASDPNLGRILAAIGYASRECESLADLNTEQLELYFGDVLVAEKGGRAQSYKEEEGQAVMNEAEIDITVQLHRGNESSTIWTCDFSYDYVRINAEYRT